VRILIERSSRSWPQIGHGARSLPSMSLENTVLHADIGEYRHFSRRRRVSPACENYVPHEGYVLSAAADPASKSHCDLPRAPPVARMHVSLVRVRLRKSITVINLSVFNEAGTPSPRRLHGRSEIPSRASAHECAEKYARIFSSRNVEFLRRLFYNAARDAI
jgi:hypothetical protein